MITWCIAHWRHAAARSEWAVDTIAWRRLAVCCWNVAIYILSDYIVEQTINRLWLRIQWQLKMHFSTYLLHLASLHRRLFYSLKSNERRKPVIAKKSSWLLLSWDRNIGSSIPLHDLVFFSQLCVSGILSVRMTCHSIAVVDHLLIKKEKYLSRLREDPLRSRIGQS